MNRATYSRTVFIPGLYGQFRLWKQSIVKILQKADNIVQLGNFVGCNDFAKDKEKIGPNEAMLKYLWLYRSTAPSWVQIAGEQEIAALNFPEQWTNNTSRAILRKAWFDEKPQMVTAAENKGRLITHGGMTYGEWLDIGKPQSAYEAAKLLNEKYAYTVHQGPCFKLGNAPNYAANPIWADPLMEYYPSWITAPEPMPFTQIHGSESINSIDGRAFKSDVHNPLHYIDRIIYRRFGSISIIKESMSIAVSIPLPGKMIHRIPEPYALYVEKQEQQETSTEE